VTSAGPIKKPTPPASGGSSRGGSWNSKVA
jgi:hypothetical protein